MVAPVGGSQEGRHGGENPTRGRWFQREMHPVDPALTGDRGAETLLTFPLNSYPRQTLVLGRSPVRSAQYIQQPSLQQPNIQQPSLPQPTLAQRHRIFNQLKTTEDYK